MSDPLTNNQLREDAVRAVYLMLQRHWHPSREPLTDETARSWVTAAVNASELGDDSRCVLLIEDHTPSIDLLATAVVRAFGPEETPTEQDTGEARQVITRMARLRTGP